MTKERSGYFAMTLFMKLFVLGLAKLHYLTIERIMSMDLSRAHDLSILFK
jgi:hypothetical protein